MRQKLKRISEIPQIGKKLQEEHTTRNKPTVAAARSTITTTKVQISKLPTIVEQDIRPTNNH